MAALGRTGTDWVIRHQVICGLKKLVSGLNRSHLFLDATDWSTMAM
jgi:hypothetical protein